MVMGSSGGQSEGFKSPHFRDFLPKMLDFRRVWHGAEDYLPGDHMQSPENERQLNAALRMSSGGFP
jgi:hypothetical protein